MERQRPVTPDIISQSEPGCSFAERIQRQRNVDEELSEMGDRRRDEDRGAPQPPTRSIARNIIDSIVRFCQVIFCCGYCKRPPPEHHFWMESPPYQRRPVSSLSGSSGTRAPRPLGRAIPLSAYATTRPPRQVDHGAMSPVHTPTTSAKYHFRYPDLPWNYRGWDRSSSSMSPELPHPVSPYSPRERVSYM